MDDHPLLRLSASRPRQESTSADPDLVYALGEFRRELASFTQSVVTNVASTADRDRFAQLCEDFAGVIRVTVGTRWIGDAIDEPTQTEQ